VGVAVIRPRLLSRLIQERAEFLFGEDADRVEQFAKGALFGITFAEPLGILQGCRGAEPAVPGSDVDCETFAFQQVAQRARDRPVYGGDNFVVRVHGSERDFNRKFLDAD